MLSTNFYGFIDFFMGGEIELQPKDVGLNSFSESEFFENNYELIGESSDFHFFEKAHDVPYFNRKAIILLKYYFNGDERLGVGLSVTGGVRLTSFLKRLITSSDKKLEITPQMDFYFSDDFHAGAVIINKRMVVRFEQWGKRNAYVISTLECDFGKEEFGSMATQAVMSMFDHISQQSMLDNPEKKTSAYGRLVNKLKILSI
ncbi:MULTISPECIES: hypothetical protein [unclassified Pseudomonas]|uniref:hypothetical protein n=2 Tax=Pseudomonas TaxID=286 RepID=UPI00111C89ED|nr:MULTISPECIES: hypothetical protein [unclassified Pseudomonas]